MIWDGCGDCKYAWPCGHDEDGDYKYLYCIPRERKCEFHFGNYRDKVCGLVEAISVGNLRKLLEGIDDSVVVDVWFHMALTKLGKDDFFGKGTLAELYDWKDVNDQTEAEKEAFKNMVLQRNPDCKFSPPENIAYMEGDPLRFAVPSKTDTKFCDMEKIKHAPVNLHTPVKLEIKTPNYVIEDVEGRRPCVLDDENM